MKKKVSALFIARAVWARFWLMFFELPSCKFFISQLLISYDGCIVCQLLLITGYLETVFHHYLSTCLAFAWLADNTTWILIISTIFWNTFYTFKIQPQYFYLRKILGGWLCISRGAAPVITLCTLGAVFAACRCLHSLAHRPLAKISTTILAKILSRITYAHMVCAVTLILFSVIHSGAHVMNAINFSRHYFQLYPEINAAKYKGENPAYLICTWTGCSGIAMLLILMLMAITSTSKFRKKYFNRFYMIHHLFVIYLLLLLTHPFRGVLKEQYNVSEHIPGCLISNITITEDNITIIARELCKNPPRFKCISTQNWVWIAIGLTVYLLELLSRRYYNNKFEAIQFCVVPGKAVHVKIKVTRNFRIKPGQYVLLQCSQISSIEWHPFTVTQCPCEQQSFDILISVRGDWTRKLFNLALNSYSFNDTTNYIFKSQISPLIFSVSGPFASPMQSVTNNKISICIAAGIGITAYIATLRNLLDTLPNRIHLLWLTRDPQQILWYSKLLANILKQLWLKNQPDKLVLQFYVTKECKKLNLEYLVQDQLILSRIHHGRPNWKEEFRLWCNMYKKTNVSVYCCGPNSLRQVLHKYCNKVNKKGNNFNFIYEGF